jgi:hypothetical protein
MAESHSDSRVEAGKPSGAELAVADWKVDAVVLTRQSAMVANMFPSFADAVRIAAHNFDRPVTIRRGRMKGDYKVIVAPVIGEDDVSGLEMLFQVYAHLAPPKAGPKQLAIA